VNEVADDLPVVVLTSGQTLRLHRIKLYEEEAVKEVATLKAQAAKTLSLGGAPSGLGVVGSPSWAVAGTAAAMSIAGGLLSGVLQKQALQLLETVAAKSEVLRRAGIFYSRTAFEL
jgi:hypothetical protein